jgi:hypothetical protein
MNMLGHAVAAAGGKGEAAWLGGLRGGGASGGFRPKAAAKEKPQQQQQQQQEYVHPFNRGAGQHVCVNEVASKWHAYEPKTGAQLHAGRVDPKKAKAAARRRKASISYGNLHSPFQKVRKGAC